MPWHILKETTEPGGPFATMPQEPWHPGKGAKPSHILQLNCGEVVDLMVWTYDLTRKDMPNKLMAFRSNRKKVECRCLAEKGHV